MFWTASFLYLRRESNPHSEEHEFESCASTNSATQASFFDFGCKGTAIFLICK